MTTTAHSVAGVAQWVLLTHEDFSEVKDWVKPNGKKIQEGVTCFQGGDDGNADAFLGPRFGPSADCGNSFFSASKTFTLPEHTEVRNSPSPFRLVAVREIRTPPSCQGWRSLPEGVALQTMLSRASAIIVFRSSRSRLLSPFSVPRTAGDGHWPLPLH